jgi:hypothetical protein
MADQSQQIELDVASTPFEPGEDRRPRVWVPPPVRLVAVEDCEIYSVAGLEIDLDQFYVDLLRFEREEGEHEIVYRAENFRLRVAVMERPMARENFRPLGVVIESINELLPRLNEAEIEFERLRGLTPGRDILLLNDPAGNPIEISESRVAI